MSEQERQPINPNTADIDALVQLPGVGPKLAARIIDGRPYAQAEDLLAVSGLGESLLASIQPQLVFDESAKTKAGDGDKSKSADVVDETVNYLVNLPAVIRDELNKKRGFNRRTTILLMGGTALVSIFLSIVLTLMVFTIVNGSLSVRRNSQVQSMASDVSQMGVELDDLDSRLQALSRRVEAVEGLSGRVTAVEDTFDVVQTDIDQAISQVETMQSTVDGLSADVETLADNIGRFDQFLTRLWELMNQLQGGAQAE